jgi:hypothetical protein
MNCDSVPPADRNKTVLTHEVTAAVAQWMDEHGFKPVETEVTVAAGWVADLAGVIMPTATELIALKLMRRAPKWSQREQRMAWESECRTLERIMTALIEVKTSRSDFLGDKKWALPPPVTVAYVAVPAGLIGQDEWPDGSIKQLRGSSVFTATLEEQLSVTLSIAVRRDHNTRYARLRELQRAKRIQQAEYRIARTAGAIARAMLDILNAKHGTVDLTLDFHNIKCLKSGYVREQLDELWGINVPRR